MSAQRARKLKDTCDVCATAKIKCDKEWPRCSRCVKLDHQCIYSPARRKGRPHPQCNPMQNILGKPVQRPSYHRSSASEPSHESFHAASLGVEQRTSHKRARQMPVSQANDRGHGAADESPDLFPDCWRDLSAYRDGSYSPANKALGTFHHTASTNLPDTPAYASASSSSSAHSVDKPIDTNSAFFDVDENTSTTECSDCTLLAMDVLQNLNAIAMQQVSQISNLSPRCFSMVDFIRHNHDAQLQATSMAIKQLTAILICPCSQNLDVGLLCAAVCTAILDSYCTILRECFETISTSPTGMNSTVSSAGNGIDRFGCTMSPFYDIFSDLGVLQSGIESQSVKMNQQAIMRRILQELPKAANAVMHFTKRYNDVGDPATMENATKLLLPMLATAQKTRLKEMVDKTTSALLSLG
ncbi:MAG: hypothetical protein Q9219_003466 [cf. Caloplaca sp. 3 TL-2023]